MKKGKLGFLLSAGILGLSAVVGSSVALSLLNSVQNKNISTFKNDDIQLANYLNSKSSFNNSTISSDFKKINSGTFRFKKINSQFQSNLVSTNDSFGLLGQDIVVPSVLKPINTKSQIRFHQKEHSRIWTSNNLNQTQNVIPALTFRKTRNYDEDFNTFVQTSIESVWSTKEGASNNGDYGMPSPRAAAGNEWFQFTDFAKSYFGSSLRNNDTRRWNLYSISDKGNGLISEWDMNATNPCKRSDINKVKNEMIARINKESLNISNDSLSFNSYAINNSKMDYEFYNNGSTAATIRIFDNTYSSWQAGSSKYNSWDYYYSNNSKDYKKDKNEDNTAMLGNLNTKNRIDNIYVDFSKLISLDFDNTSTYYDADTKVHKTAPKIVFGWNLELFNALKEMSNIAKLTLDIFDDWNTIANFSTNVSNEIKKLLLDIYNQKASEADIRSYLKKLKDSNGSNLIYTPISSKANYVQVLEQNNWNFSISPKTSLNSSNEIIDTVNEIAQWGYVYDYVLPQVFRNDIFVEYKQTGENDWTQSESQTKIYDGSTFTWSPLVLKNYETQANQYNNNYEFVIRNIYMKTANGVKVAGFNASENKTLNMKNIFNVATNHAKTRGLKNDIKFEWDNFNNGLKLSFAYNPSLNEVDDIKVDSKNRSITSMDGYVYDIIYDEDKKRNMSKAVVEAINVPQEEIDKVGGNIQLLFNWNNSFNAPDIQLNDEEYSEYKDLLIFIEKMIDFDKKQAKYVANEISEQEMLDAKKSMDKLGYFYISIDLRYPIDYYLNPTNYWELTQDQSIIPQGTRNGFYRYFVKINSSKTPLEIDKLGDYIKVTKDGVSVEEQEKVKQLKSEVIQTKNDFEKQVQQISKDLPIKTEGFKNILKGFLNQVNQVGSKLEKLKEDLNKYDQQLDNDLETIKEYENTFFEVFNAFEKENTKLSVLETIEKEAIEAIQNEQKAHANSLVAKIQKIMSEHDKQIQQLDKYKNQKVFELLRGNSELTQKYENIISKYDTKRSELKTKIQNGYDEFANNHDYEGSGFVKVADGSFDYIDELEQIKETYIDEMSEIDNLFANTNDDLKDEIKDYANKIQNLIDDEKTKTQEFIDTELSNFVKEQDELFNREIATYLNKKYEYLRDLLTSYLMNQYSKFNSQTFDIYKLIDSKNQTLDKYVSQVENYGNQLTELFKTQNKLNDLRDELNNQIQEIKSLNEHQYLSIDFDLNKLFNDSNDNNVTNLFEAVDNKRFNLFFYVDKNKFIDKLNSIISSSTNLNIELTEKEFFQSYSYGSPESAYKENERGSTFKHDVVYDDKSWKLSKWTFKVNYKTSFVTKSNQIKSLKKHKMF